MVKRWKAITSLLLPLLAVYDSLVSFMHRFAGVNPLDGTLLGVDCQS